MVRFLEVNKPRGILQSGGFYMVLLALQFGCQPLLVQTFISKESPKVTIVKATEAVKILLCATFLVAEGRETLRRIYKTWTLRDSLRLSALPAACYAVQNVLAQVGYQNLDSLTYNLLNQTKTIAAALCLFLLTGKRQTFPQMVALALLLIASVMVNWQVSGSKESVSRGAVFYSGVVAVLLASFLSGLSAAVTEKVLQGLSRNSYLFSMELALYGQVVLYALPFLLSLLPSPLTASIGLQAASSSSPSSSLPVCPAASTSTSTWADVLSGGSVCGGPLHGWTLPTLIPVVANSLGGIIVGLVTKYAGGVAKGFALIAGILLTAFLQACMTATPPPLHHWLAAVLVAISTYLHATYPPGPPPTPATAVVQNTLRMQGKGHWPIGDSDEEEEEEKDKDKGTEKEKEKGVEREKEDGRRKKEE